MISFPSVLESIADLTKNQIEGLLSLSDKFQLKIHEDPRFLAVSRPIIATSFLENSTRTKHSFAIAIQRLGAMYIDFNAETSSLKKGESLEETLLTLHAQGVNLCIVRTSISHQFSEFKVHPPIKIINGGDGINEHPTQALLDLFTLSKLAGGILNLQGKTISILGDNIHSRVGHSLLKLLPQFGMKVILCGPDFYLPKRSELESGIEISNDRNTTLSRSDFIYLLRIQKERHALTSENEDIYNNYLKNYGISLSLLRELNKNVPVLHPGPCNVGVEIDSKLIKSPLYKGHFQVENSIAMRMAIIQAMLNNNDKNIGIIHGEKF